MLGLTTIALFRKRAATGEILSINDLASTIKESQMTTITPEAVAWKRYEQMRPRVATTPDHQNMKSCCGHFQFEGGTLINVFMQQEKLLTQIPGQPVFNFSRKGRMPISNMEYTPKSLLSAMIRASLHR